MRIILVSVLAVIASTAAFAQTPEFGLGIRLYLDGDPPKGRTLYLGYDPTASDSLEGKWYTDKYVGGEQIYPPPFQDDFRFTGQAIGRGGELGDGSPIDIRHKPDSVSFQLSYEIQMTLVPGHQLVTLGWSNNSIPPIIHNMILEPATVSPEVRKKTEMKGMSQFEIPADSIGKYSRMIITLYYNRDYPQAAVHGQDEFGQSLTLFANPMIDRLSGSINVTKAGDIKLMLLDIAGRIIYENVRYCEAGLNQIDVDCHALTSGAYKLVVLSGLKSVLSQTVIVSK